jgi:hypothetical protein
LLFQWGGQQSDALDFYLNRCRFSLVLHQDKLKTLDNRHGSDFVDSATARFIPEKANFFGIILGPREMGKRGQAKARPVLFVGSEGTEHFVVAEDATARVC